MFNNEHLEIVNAYRCAQEDFEKSDIVRQELLFFTLKAAEERFLNLLRAERQRRAAN